MKQKIFSMLLLLTVSVGSWASTKIGDLYYDLNATDKTAEVTYEIYSSTNYSTLTSVTIPKTVTDGTTTYSVTSIGNDAFFYCSGLTSVTIPNSVTFIGYQAFDGCSGLTSVTIPNSVDSIGWSAFSDCSGLTVLNVDKSNARYSSTNGVVYSKAMDTLICCPAGKAGVFNIPNTVKVIKGSAFSGCSKLTSVTIPNTVTSIGWSAFSYCSGLTSVTIPNSVTSIGYEAFGGCTSLNTLYFNAKKCEDIVDYEGVKISESLFSQCPLTKLVIGDSVTIPECAFKGCSKLTSVTIPSSVTSIKSNAFSDCSGLTSITCKAASPYVLVGDAFSNVSTTIPVYVPCGSVSTFKSTYYWSRFANIQAIEGSCDATMVENTSIANAKLYTQGKEIIVAFGSNQAVGVQIYDLGGKLVYSSASGDVDFDAPRSGVYVVKINGVTEKVVVK